MATLSLFDGDGDQEGSVKDPRLERQLVRVYRVMRDNGYLTLSEVSELADAPEASVSARLRDLRKPRFGGFEILDRHLGDGLYAYRLVPDSGDPELVFNPAPDPRSRKKEAREILRAWLSGGGSVIGPHQRWAIEEMLR